MASHNVYHRTVCTCTKILAFGTVFLVSLFGKGYTSGNQPITMYIPNSSIYIWYIPDNLDWYIPTVSLVYTIQISTLTATGSGSTQGRQQLNLPIEFNALFNQICLSNSTVTTHCLFDCTQIYWFQSPGSLHSRSFLSAGSQCGLGSVPWLVLLDSTGFPGPGQGADSPQEQPGAASFSLP